jgi:hypothetical protein
MISNILELTKCKNKDAIKLKYELFWQYICNNYTVETFHNSRTILLIRHLQTLISGIFFVLFFAQMIIL